MNHVSGPFSPLLSSLSDSAESPEKQREMGGGGEEREAKRNLDLPGPMRGKHVYPAFG